MKKVFILSFVLSLSLTIGCNKQDVGNSTQSTFNEISEFILEISSTTNFNVGSKDYYNNLNPLENTFRVYDKTILHALKNNEITKGVDIQNLFNDDFIDDLPVLNPDFLDEHSLGIMNQIDILLESSQHNDFCNIMIQLESKLLASENLEKEYVDLLVVYSTTLRHLSIIMMEFSNSKGSLEDCFVDKLRELNDCGNCWIERILCIANWPLCLGSYALDCLIDQI